MEHSSKKSYTPKSTLSGLLTALGLYGVIGTTPLYLMKLLIYDNNGINRLREDYILGILSLIFWTLTILTTVKYVLFVLRADNNGEGGIFSLFTLVREQSKWLIIPAMIGGAALLAYGVFTTTVTVTSATSTLASFDWFYYAGGSTLTIIVIFSIFMLLILFYIPHIGVKFIEKLSGPIMLLWFISLAFFGIINLLSNLSLLRALSPYYAINLLLSDKNTSSIGFSILGIIVLCSSGAHALYSNLGRTERKNIYLTWPFVKICLLLSYFGQASWILYKYNHPTCLAYGISNFYEMFPSFFLEMLSYSFTRLFPGQSIYQYFRMFMNITEVYGSIISILAVFIASRSVISGIFTLLSEAMDLHLFPKLRTLYPYSFKKQPYIPSINHILCAACIGTVLYFQNIERMKESYSLTMATAMLMTTILLFNFMRKKKMPFLLASIIFVPFMAFEVFLIAANIIKYTFGGVIALLMIAIILFIMYLSYKSYIAKEHHQ